MRIALLATLLAGNALAVTTSDWTHSSESDFNGKAESVVVSPFGELRLSRAATPLLQQDATLEIVYAAVSLPDGTLVIASGPTGMISRVENDARRTLYTAGGALATALAINSKGQLLAAFSGDRARLVRVDATTGEAADLYSSDDVKFIWAIHPMADGSVLLGTGPTGQLLHISADGTSRVVLQTRQKNILSIVGQSPDQVIVGTDPDGLVMRVNITNGDWFVLHDATEPEIVALALHPNGSIYAAASSAIESATPEASDAQAPGGRELGPDVPIRREPPAAPEPPVLPDPAPGEPEPIPQQPIPDVIPEAPVEPAGDAHASPTPTGNPGTPPASGESPSSAVYRIAPAGFVSESFRAPVTIHSMLLLKDSLLLGTGPEGALYEMPLATEEKLVIYRADSRQVSAITAAGKDNLAIGVSNPGGLLQLTAGFAQRGVYTSDVLDAGQVAQFGKLQLQGTMPAETSVSVSTRSGNLKDPDKGGWSTWSEDVNAAEFLPITSPAARFAQYRLTFTTRDPAASPTVDEVKLNYLLPNMPPQITRVILEPEAAESADDSPAMRAVNWEVTDPNGDTLQYELHYRMGHRGDWILLKDKLKETSYRWNTRQLADGRYQLRVTASDQASNAASAGLTATRFSDSVRVDNTPPAIGDIATQVQGTTVEVRLRAVDRTSTVAEVHYALDSSDDWQAATSSDMLYDSPDETVRFVARDLASGTHQVAIRARDSQGNTAYETLIVTVDKQEKR